MREAGLDGAARVPWTLELVAEGAAVLQAVPFAEPSSPVV